MIQLGGFIFGSPYLWDSSNIRFKGLLSSAKSISNSIVKTVNNVDPVDTGLSLLVKKIIKGISSIKDSGITLTNNEIKDIMKVIKSLENRGILLKGTTRKITSQEERFFNFLRPLMTAGLLFIKNILIPLT